jgi:hypothetical protein
MAIEQFLVVVVGTIIIPDPQLFINEKFIDIKSCEASNLPKECMHSKPFLFSTNK